MQATYTMGMQPDGRELLLVVVKGTFTIPKHGEEAKLAAQQAPPVDADVFTGEPGFSAPVYESDYAPVKPRCDVILNGSAHAPGGHPTQRVTVSLRLGPMHKRFDVAGNRLWRKDVFGLAATEPEYFTLMPISYDNAFGGVDNLNPDPEKHDAYLSNPVGKGFYPISKAKIDGTPVPNTEESGTPITSPTGSYRAMSFGPIGRAWRPRPKYAGTYDQDWIDNVFPFLPSDFEDRYYQCAPEDQQTDYLRGGEELELVNLTPEGYVRFRLPTVEVPVTFYLKNYEQTEIAAVCDTLVIEPDLERFTMVWRASLPLRRNMFEVAQVITGRMPRGWYRARELGKTYYGSLKELVDARRGERGGVEENSDEEVKEIDLETSAPLIPELFE
jgi:hypothetical protein